MFRHLLVPTDGSPLALDAARLATVLTSPGAGITLLHVHQEGELTALTGLDVAATVIGGAPGGWRLRRSVELEQEGAEVLSETRAAIVAERQVETVFTLGRPADVALEYLERPEFDGAVFGSRGKGPIAGALLGSVSDALLRHAVHPVVVARRPEVGSLLVAFDGSESARRALRQAVEIATSLDADLLLACVAPVPEGLEGEHGQELELDSRRQAERVLESARTLTGKARVKELLLRGHPAAAPLEEVGRSRPDLVVLGRRGVAPSYRVPLGSVALRVATHADTSVMLVP